MSIRDEAEGVEPDPRPFAVEPPKVSYVLPVLNEAAALDNAISSVLAQSYAGDQEVIIAVAPSHDGTREAAEQRAINDSRIHVVDNPDTDIPAGLNRAVAASLGEVVVRVDAHTELPPDYTARMVDALRRTGAASVGGVMLARGETPFQRSVARIYNSGLGLGGGAYHGGGVEGPGESAYLGVFRRELVDTIGWYDETLRRAEDYELSQRIHAAGLLVWLMPDVQVTYRPRTSWGALAKQMYATGVWRGELVRRARSTSPRYLAAPSLVTGLSTCLAVGAAQLAGASRWPWSIVYAVPLAYGGFLTFAAVHLDGESLWERIRDAGVVAATHVTWGAGFLKGVTLGARSTIDRSRVTRGARRRPAGAGRRPAARLDHHPDC